eukprot:7469983-Pyramimonas_sp.AAC.1
MSHLCHTYEVVARMPCFCHIRPHKRNTHTSTRSSRVVAAGSAGGVAELEVCGGLHRPRRAGDAPRQVRTLLVTAPPLAHSWSHRLLHTLGHIATCTLLVTLSLAHSWSHRRSHVLALPAPPPIGLDTDTVELTLSSPS